MGVCGYTDEIEMTSAKKVRTKILRKGFVLGAEFALSVIVLIFLGYFLGGSVSDVMAKIGMIVGAFAGFVIGMYRLINQVG